MKTTTALLALLLAGCATAGPPPEPKIVTREVKVEVARPCPATLPAAPTYTDTKAALAAAGGPEDRYRLMAGNWFKRDARLALIEAVVATCMKAP